MTFALILHFVLNGHVHTVDTGHAFASKQECNSAGETAKGSVNSRRANVIRFLV